MSLTENRNTARRIAVSRSVIVAADAVIFAGALVAVNAAGKAVPASDAAGLKVAGRAERYGVAGDVVNVECGCFAWDLADGETATLANIGQLAYVMDDCTVSLLAGDNAIIAGEIFDVDDEGIWVVTPAGGRPGADGTDGADGEDGVNVEAISADPDAASPENFGRFVVIGTGWTEGTAIATAVTGEVYISNGSAWVKLG